MFTSVPLWNCFGAILMWFLQLSVPAILVWLLWFFTRQWLTTRIDVANRVRLFIFTLSLALAALSGFFVEAIGLSEWATNNTESLNERQLALLSCSLATITAAILLDITLFESFKNLDELVSKSRVDETLAYAFLQVVGRKRDRIANRKQEVIGCEDAQNRVEAIHHALNPKKQITLLVVAARKIIAEWGCQGNEKDSVRAALFKVTNDRKKLKTLMSVDGSGANCTSAPELPLSGKPETIAAAAVRTGKISFESDTKNAGVDSEFNFLGTRQKSRLKSIVAIPIGLPDKPQFVVSFDASRANFFLAKDLEFFQSIKQNIETRLLYEVDMFDILSSVRKRYS